MRICVTEGVFGDRAWIIILMAGNAYHKVRYITSAIRDSHPDRLASVAILLGMNPAPITKCRVLELGCGSGGNLIPMAYFLPGSRFTGVDLADRPIAEGRQAAEELGLRNIELVAMDLREVGPEFGQFDYIIAAGLYSWVPPDVRERLLDVCRERLAPHGVAYINYNALPGRSVRMMLREMMMYHTRDVQSEEERIKLARELLQRLKSSGMAPAAWQPLLEYQINDALRGDEGWFYHDDLSPASDAFYVRDFIANAERHSLQYLSDALPHLTFDTTNPLDWVTGGITEREQYADFLCLRQFRQSLVCHKEVKLERPLRPERMDRFRFASPARKSDGQIEGFHSVCLKDLPQPVARVVAALGEAFPQSVEFDDLLGRVKDRGALRGILFTLVTSGFASLHVRKFPATKASLARPRATTLARWESRHAGRVTYGNHTPHDLDPGLRTLIDLMDGSRDVAGIASELSKVEGAPPVDAIRARLPDVLKQMAETGLLEG